MVELLDGRSAATEPPLLSALEVARHFGVGRKWVYEHAEELGAIRLGAGCRARMRFDATVVAERINRVRPARTATRERKSGSSAPPELLPIYGRPTRR